MLGKTNAISPAGGTELVTGTIHGPSGFVPTITLIYSDGEAAQYVDITRNATVPVRVAKNSIICSKAFHNSPSPTVLGDAEIVIKGEESESCLWVFGDFTLNLT